MVKKKKDKMSKLLKVNIAPQLTKEQDMLHELFGGSDSFGTGQNLPKIDHKLSSGEGIIKSGDYEGETASMFGFIRRR